MNFVEAAITLLQEAGKPLPVEALCDLALERGLLDRPGTSPLRSMKGRLTTELHRGDESRLAKLDDDTWALREGGGPEAGAAAEEPEQDAEELEVAAALGDDDEDEDVEDQFGEDFGDLGEEDDDLDDEDDDLAAADEDDLDDDDDDDDDDLEEDDDDEDDDDDDELAADDDEEEDEDAPAPGVIAEPLPDAGTAAETAEDTVSPPAVHAGEPEPAPEEGERPRGRRRRRRRRRRGGREDAAAEGAAADAEGADVVPIAGQAAEELDDEDDEDDEDLPEPEPLVPEGPEEEEFARVYSEDLDGTTPVGEVREYSDHQTVDEDRPMLPEIKADRRAHMRSRRDERRSRREKERPARASRRRDRDRPGEAREAREPREPREPSAAGGGEVAPRATLADLAYTTLASLQNGQAIHCGQLAQMMRKRDLISGDPGAMAPLIKAALIDDTNARFERGLRPRVDHRGRGTFVARPLSDDALRRAERAVADAMARLESATRAAIKARVARLGQAALERLCHLWLERTGWHDLQWIKRSGPSSYALAETPFGRERWLIGVRSGNDLVDRRGIGELRAGLTAKDLTQGLLVAPRGLSDEARAELCKEGRPLTLVCGDDLVTALVHSGVGVITASARIAYPDSELFDELP